MLTDNDVFKLTGGERYWDRRPKTNTMLAAVVAEAIENRNHRARVVLYVLGEHYRLVREDSGFKQNPLLSDYRIASFGAGTTQDDVFKALINSKVKAAQAPAAPGPLLPPQ